MIRTWARRCIPRRGPSTWRDANTRCRPFSTPTAPAAQRHPRRPHLRQSTIGKSQIDTRGVSDKPAVQERDLPGEPDWSLYKNPLPPVEEQEARFERSATGKITCTIKALCPACGSHVSHSLAACPLVFPDNPLQFWTPGYVERKFNERMKNSQEFHDAVVFMRRTFVHRTPSGHHIFVPRSETQDAPPLARGKKTSLLDPSVSKSNLDVTCTMLIVIAWLHKFSNLVNFTRSNAGQADRSDWVLPAYSLFNGYYPTTDDDGRPFLILFTNSGHFDERMPYGMCFPDHFISSLAISSPRMRTASGLPPGRPSARAVQLDKTRAARPPRTCPYQQMT